MYGLAVPPVDIKQLASVFPNQLDYTDEEYADLLCNNVNCCYGIDCNVCWFFKAKREHEDYINKLLAKYLLEESSKNGSLDSSSL